MLLGGAATVFAFKRLDMHAAKLPFGLANKP